MPCLAFRCSVTLDLYVGFYGFNTQPPAVEFVSGGMLPDEMVPVNVRNTQVDVPRPPWLSLSKPFAFEYMKKCSLSVRVAQTYVLRQYSAPRCKYELPLAPLKRVDNVSKTWTPGTHLIVYDSMFNGLNEKDFKRSYKVKIRSFPGATVDDLYDYLPPLLRKAQSELIIHIGTNDAPHNSAIDIFLKIRNLVTYIQSCLPMAHIYISCPIFRADSDTANHTLQHLRFLLKASYVTLMHGDINGTCLNFRGAWAGLHLNKLFRGGA